MLWAFLSMCLCPAPSPATPGPHHVPLQQTAQRDSQCPLNTRHQGCLHAARKEKDLLRFPPAQDQVASETEEGFPPGLRLHAL